MIRLASILFVMLLLPLNAMAVEINDQGAQKLKTSFGNILAYQKEVNEAFGSVRVIYEGEITVKQESEYYTITLPRILLKSPIITPAEGNEETELDDQTFDIGIISINAMPDEKDGHWKTTWTLPETMTMSGEADTDFSIRWGEQNIIALLDDTLGYFTKMNLNLSNVSFNIEQEDIGVSIGNLQFYMNLDKNDAGTFSGPAYALISDLLIAPQEENSTVKIGELKIGSTMTAFSLPTLTEYKAKLMNHAGVFQSLNKIGNEEDAKNVNGQDVMDMIFDLYDIDMNGFDIEYSLKNLEINPAPEDEDRGFDTLKLSSAFMGFGFNNLNSEKGELNIKTGYDTIDIQSDNPDHMSFEFIPAHTNFDIKVENIPYKTLSEIAKNSAASLARNPESAQMVGMSLLMKLPAILSQANTKLVIKDNNVKNDIYDISLNGQAVTNLTAIMGFSAKFNIIFQGLDALLSRIPRDTETTDTTDIIKQLEKLKSLGKPNTEDNGKTSYSFEFEATPQGAFLLNGQDTSTIDFD